MVGAYLASSILLFGASQTVLETASRSMGFEPRWPFFEGDYQLEEFSDLPTCADNPNFDSATSFTVYLVGGTIIGGMVIGAVSGTAKAILNRPA